MPYAPGTRQQRIKPIIHGTVAGYKAEKRCGEEACQACKKAWRLYYARRANRLPRFSWLHLQPDEKIALIELRKEAKEAKEFRAWKEQRELEGNIHSTIRTQVNEEMRPENEVELPGRPSEESEHGSDQGGFGDASSHGSTTLL